MNYTQFGPKTQNSNAFEAIFQNFEKINLNFILCLKITILTLISSSKNQVQFQVNFHCLFIRLFHFSLFTDSNRRQYYFKKLKEIRL